MVGPAVVVVETAAEGGVAMGGGGRAATKPAPGQGGLEPGLRLSITRSPLGARATVAELPGQPGPGGHGRDA
jgi:hypothetical protein